MATLKHTPGPWLIAGEDKSFVYALGPTGQNSFWAHVQAAGQDRVSPNEKAANATLIAAAPDMLQLLRHAWDSYMADPDPHALGRTMSKIEDLLWRLDGNE